MTPLPPRLDQIARLIAVGLPNKLIAAEMGLTYGTVKQHLYRLYRRVGVSNRTELANWTRDHLR